MSITRRSKGARRVPDLWQAPRSALLALAGCLVLLPVARAAGGLQEPESCRVVRLSDIGWTAESVATAVFAKLLTDLGYQPQVTVLSVPVTFESMSNGDIDIFLGNWLPAQGPLLQPFLDDHSIDLVRKNLVGAKYTLGVPDYLYNAGLHDFADIRRFRKELGASIYGIEPGNDGNLHVIEMIEKNDIRPRRVPARRIERTGHARRSRAGGPREAADRVPRVGSAPDEHALQHPLPDGRRRHVRSKLRCRDGQHARARGIFHRVSERRTPARELRADGRPRERVDGWLC